MAALQHAAQHGHGGVDGVEVGQAHADDLHAVARVALPQPPVHRRPRHQQRGVGVDERHGPPAERRSRPDRADYRTGRSGVKPSRSGNARIGHTSGLATVWSRRSEARFILVGLRLPRDGEERRRSGRTSDRQVHGETEMRENSTDDRRLLDECDEAQPAATAEFDQAFAWLRQSARDRDSHVIWVGLDFIFAELRQDPRYAAFVREVGLPH
jgi:hypothetical protein